MTDTNNTRPTRCAAIDYLSNDLRFCLSIVGQSKVSAPEKNAALAFCELAVSLPPEWFTTIERQIVVALIRELYGSPHDFIAALSDGSVSYYNHMMAQMETDGAPTITLEAAVVRLMEMHFKECGTLPI
jgi:hypothetical protein